MRKAALFAVFAWWFVAYARGFTPVGPFANQAECEQVRSWAANGRPAMGFATSWCWWDGKP